MITILTIALTIVILFAVVMVALLIYMLRTGVRAISFTMERPQKRQEAQR